MCYACVFCGLRNVVSLFPNYHIDDDYTITMSDGIILTATVYTPTTDKTVHTILIRTPYGRWLLSSVCMILAQVGYRVLCQDTRGRWTSGGTYESSLLGSEASDGYDTVKWIQVRYPGSKIGLMGISYLGYVQWATVRALIERDGTSEAVTSMMPIACASDMYPILFNGSGCIPSIDFLTRWALFTFTIGRIHVPGVTGVVQSMYYTYKSLFQTTPVVGMTHQPVQTIISSMLTPIVTEAEGACDIPSMPFIHKHESDYWKHRSHRETLTMGPIPSCVLATGWYDIFLEGTIIDYRILRHADPSIRLVIGPWHHVQTTHPAVFGGLLYTMLTHFNHTMPCQFSVDTEEEDPILPVHVFLHSSMLRTTRFRGSLIRHVIPSFLLPTVPGTWVQLSSWPPVDVMSERLWLSFDKRLVSTPEGATSGTQSYVFDPCTPTPSHGTDTFHYVYGGPFEITKAVHARTDCMHCTSDVLPDGIVLAGHVSAFIQATYTGAKSVDYVVRLCEVYPDDTCIVLAEGIERVMNSVNMDSTHVKIEIGSIGRIVKPGQRLRIYICSSAYPRWMINKGGDEIQMVSTHQIRCAPGEPDASYIVLPTFKLP